LPPSIPRNGSIYAFDQDRDASAGRFESPTRLNLDLPDTVLSVCDVRKKM
jgi:hypothetical protein